MHSGLTRFVACDPARIRVEQPELDRERQMTEQVRRQTMAEAEKKFAVELGAIRNQQRQRWEAMDREIGGFLDSFEKRVIDQLLDLSIRIAEVLVRRSLPDRELVRDVIRQTLSPITDLQGVRVRLHRSDADSLIATRGTASPAGVEDKVEIVADSTLSPGDVMIESRNGYFDARIGERIKLVDEKLRERLKGPDENSQ